MAQSGGADDTISTGHVWRETCLLVSLVIGTYLVEFLKVVLFHGEMPIATELVLDLLEVGMIILALRYVARVLAPLMLGTPFGLAPRSAIGPIGWGFVGALVILATAAFSLVVVGMPWLSMASLAFGACFVIVVMFLAANTRALLVKAASLFFGVPVIMGALLCMLIAVAWMLEQTFGGGITARTVIEMLLHHGGVSTPAT